MIDVPDHLHAAVIWMSCAFGLVIGSFLNVVGHRYLADESIVSPPSHCPNCKTPLRIVDNIPVVSYLILGGACRACKKPISMMYPMIELATALLFAATVWMFGVSWQSLFLLVLISNLMVITITDLRESLIFTNNSLVLIPLGLLYSWFDLGQTNTGFFTLPLGAFVLEIPHTILSSLMAILGAVIFFEGSNLFSRLLVGENGFGDGDTHLMMGVGAYFGWQFSLLALALGFVLQTVLAIPMLVVQWIREGRYVSLISGGVAITFSLLPVYLMSTPIDVNARSLYTMGCVLITLVALFFFMREIRQSQAMTFLPLGPALVLGTLVTLFWGEPLLNVVMGLWSH